MKQAGDFVAVTQKCTLMIEVEPAVYSIGQDLVLDRASRLFRPRVKGRPRMKVPFKVVVRAVRYQAISSKVTVDMIPTPHGGLHR